MKHSVASLLLAASLLPAARAAAMEGTGLQTCIAVDLVGSFKVGKDSPAVDRFDVREAEAIFYAPIDHVFDGVMSLAAHREDGVSLFEIHEAVISSSKLIPRSSFRLGQFFLGIGRLGRVHRHDWPFISSPKIFDTVFGGHGVLDTGAEYTWIVPTPFFLDVTAGVTNGWTYGHAHNEGQRPRTPTHYSRVSTYAGLPSNGGLQLGLNYLGRRDDAGERTTVVGLDGAAKWREGNYLALLIQTEAWWRAVQPKDGETTRVAGAYLYPQYALTSQLSAGVRADYFTQLDLVDAAGEKLKNGDLAFVPTVTYKASEFSTLRLAYTHEIRTLDGQDNVEARWIETQATYIIGAHPAHDF